MAELKTRILVVDDDQRLRELLVKYLSGEGYEVKAVPDARGMDKQLGRERYDLVGLDLMLPGEDGLALCRPLAASCIASGASSSTSPRAASRARARACRSRRASSPCSRCWCSTRASRSRATS